MKEIKTPNISQLFEKLGLFAVVVLLATLTLVLCGCGSNSAQENSGKENNTQELGNKVVSIAETVNDYSWEDLSNISQEIASTSSDSEAIEIAKKYHLTTADGLLDGTQAKTIVLSNGRSVEVQIVGFRHDDKTSGGKAGITFIFKDSIDHCAMNATNTNAGGWESSQMRSWLASDGMNMLPSELSDRIVEVDKMTNNVGETTSVASVTATSDKLWLFSVAELCGPVDWEADSANCNDIFNAEGTEYKLFSDLAVDSTDGNSILEKTRDGNKGNPCTWWERSTHPNVATVFMEVYVDGYPGWSSRADCTRGVVPGFCI